MDEAEVLCDRVAIIDSGKIIAMATPDGLIDDLVASGFEKPKEVKKANLEDVFTNPSYRETFMGRIGPHTTSSPQVARGDCSH